MSKMNALLVLAGEHPDIVGSLERGTNAGRNAFRNALYRQHGPGIAAGEQNALNALAQFDPNASLNAMRVHQDMALSEERAGFARAANNRAQAAETRAQHWFDFEKAKAGDAQELKKYQGVAERAIGLISSAKTPQEWDQMVRTYEGTDSDLIGQFGQKEALLARLIEANQGVAARLKFEMDANTPAPPGNDYERYAARETSGGRVPLDEFAYRERVNATKAPMVQNIVGGPIGDEMPAAPNPETVTSGLPDGAGAETFGLTGALKNTANTASDFVLGKEVFAEAGEANRFFRDLEESGLIGLAQAYPRQPAMALMERLRKLLPNVGTMQGAASAHRELVQMRSRFERDLRNANRMQGRGSASAQAETSRRVLALQGLIQQVDEGIRLLSPNAGGTGQTEGVTGRGVRFRVVE